MNMESVGPSEYGESGSRRIWRQCDPVNMENVGSINMENVGPNEYGECGSQ